MQRVCRLLGRKRSYASNVRLREKAGERDGEEVSFYQEVEHLQLFWVRGGYKLTGISRRIHFRGLSANQLSKSANSLFKLNIFSSIDRERQDIRNTHLDGMSSDDEIADHDMTTHKNQLSKRNKQFLCDPHRFSYKFFFFF